MTLVQNTDERDLELLNVCVFDLYNLDTCEEDGVYEGRKQKLCKTLEQLLLIIHIHI